jgi:hypothetical protein
LLKGQEILHLDEASLVAITPAQTEHGCFMSEATDRTTDKRDGNRLGWSVSLLRVLIFFKGENNFRGRLF